MRLLLDTHAAVWAVTEPEKLPERVADLIADGQNEVFVSAVVLWEIAIKAPLGRHDAPTIGARDAHHEFGLAGFETLPITSEHAIAVLGLPRLHADPFDRMLVAQSITESMRLVTHDAKLAAYSETIISW